ncbi:MAG TPA: hypothetical protein VHS59_11760 [Bacillota bacterium]|nr:hypothetical protein [Bacillota bacterium]
MRTGILITARLGSTRLAKKHLLKINGVPILQFLLERIQREFAGELKNGKAQIAIATSDEPENREFELFDPLGVKTFYGSRDNIPLRHYQAAQALDFDNLVAVDGDDILCGVSGMRQVYHTLAGGAQMAKTSGLPFGMNCMGYSRQVLEKALEGHTGDSLETGWGRIFAGVRTEEVEIPFPIKDDRLRFTLDYEDDFRFFKSVIQQYGPGISSATDEEIVRFVMQNSLYLLNEAINTEYWNNFNNAMEKEARKNESK